MRTNARFVPAAAAALLLAASAAAVLGCQPAKQPDLLRPPNVVCVIVTYNPDTKKAEMSPSDKKIKLSEKFKDTVQWVSPDGLVYVDKWSPGLPFDSPPKHEKKVLKSLPPKKGTAGQGFDYTAELALNPDGTTRVPIDPRIEILE